MSWLIGLRDYAEKYSHELQRAGFQEFASSEGPGMGALIGYTNGKIEFRLINDRSQLLIHLKQNGDTKEDFDLAPVLALVHHRNETGGIVKLVKKEKERFWKVGYNYADPLPSLLASLNEIDGLLSSENASETRSWIEEYYRGRGKWMFPKTRKKRSRY